MKHRYFALLSGAAISATFAYATQNITQVQHVIVVIQENRSPDNLFGSDVFAASRQLPGGDLITLNGVNQAKCNSSTPNTNFLSYGLDTCMDPDHGHNLSPNSNAWTVTYDGGQMDGACDTYNAAASSCIRTTNGYAQDSYVDNSTSLVQPYFDIAKTWGFANYMFQTNQGPSFEAHQFLFNGTSAPAAYNDSQTCPGAYPHCWEWFAAENLNNVGKWGCPSLLPGTPPTYDQIWEVNPGGNEGHGYTPSGTAAGYPCWNHNTMATLLDDPSNNITWAYYPQGPDYGSSLWTAPNAISGICQPDSTGACTTSPTSEWVKNVANHAPPYPAVAGQMAPILTDIANCSLKQVSWVVPNGVWSDHPGCPSGGCKYNNGQLSGHIYGPSWVADIVNAVGGATACDTNGYWNDTVILIVWDDWGGWYDHISPSQTGAPGIGYSNSTGQQYVYGFRVPLLVVSAYARQAYISGACGNPSPSCPNLQVPYVHDFGSILNFIEYAFGTCPSGNCSSGGGQFLHLSGQLSGTGISPNYPYADVLAPDGPTTCGSACPYGLSDFFEPNFGQSHPFPAGGISAPCQANWFENFGINPPPSCTFGPAFPASPTYPASADPDNDAVPPTAPPVP